MPNSSSKPSNFPYILLGAYIAWFLVLAIHPYERFTWMFENLPIVIAVAVLVATFKRHRFSNLAYALMAVLVFLHTLGGHYTFERVPFGWVTETFGFQRNHFDRIAHFSVGFWAYPLAELCEKKGWVRGRVVLYAFPITAIWAWGGLYEVVEWLYAAGANSELGAQFLGSQGDVWDAQKDMLADGLGSFVAMALYRIVKGFHSP